MKGEFLAQKLGGKIEFFCTLIVVLFRVIWGSTLPGNHWRTHKHPDLYQDGAWVLTIRAQSSRNPPQQVYLSNLQREPFLPCFEPSNQRRRANLNKASILGDFSVLPSCVHFGKRRSRRLTARTLCQSWSILRCQFLSSSNIRVYQWSIQHIREKRAKPPDWSL